MTTALEARVLPKIPVRVKTYGTLATFTLYSAATVDTDASSVTLGAPTVYQRYVTPPTDLAATFDGAGNMVEKQGVRFFLPSGALTSDPLPFTPELGLRCTVRGKAYRATLVDPKPTGDQLAGYFVEART